MDPYETLGVEENANDEEIVRAYRKKAMECHPDHGGDAEDVKEVNLAYDILSDPIKRRQYDECGSTDVGANTAAAGAISIVQQVLSEILSRGGDPEKQDVMNLVELKIQERRSELLQAKRQLIKNIKKGKKVAKRFTRKDGDDRNNVVRMAVLGPVTRMEGELKEVGRKLLELDDIKEFLQDYDYDHDELEESGWPPRFDSFTMRASGGHPPWETWVPGDAG